MDGKTSGEEVVDETLVVMDFFGLFFLTAVGIGAVRYDTVRCGAVRVASGGGGQTVV